jgi:hypothetical protein
VEERYETDLAHSERVLEDVERALERLSQGRYGSCETCGAPIHGHDLEADPTRRVCEQHLAIDRTTGPTTGPHTTGPEHIPSPGTTEPEPGPGSTRY